MVAQENERLQRLKQLRARQKISVSKRGTTRKNGIIPLAVEVVPLDRNRSHVFIRDFESRGVSVGVKVRLHGKARRSCSGCNQLDDNLVVCQGLASPVLADERKKAMFNFVPLARPRRQVADGDS